MANSIGLRWRFEPAFGGEFTGPRSYRARPGNFAAITRYLDRLPEQEFAVVCIVDATARDADLTITAAYQHWAAAHGELLSGH